MRNLRRIRAEKGLTMDVLEERTGVSKRTISEIERGMRTPLALTLAKLANALDVKLDDLLEDEAPKAKASPGAGQPDPDLDRLPPMARRTLQRLLRAKEDKDTYWDVQDIIGMREEFQRLGISNEVFVVWLEQATPADLDAPAPEEEPRRRETPGQTARALMSK